MLVWFFYKIIGTSTAHVLNKILWFLSLEECATIVIHSKLIPQKFTSSTRPGMVLGLRSDLNQKSSVEVSRTTQVITRSWCRWHQTKVHLQQVVFSTLKPHIFQIIQLQRWSNSEYLFRAFPTFSIFLFPIQFTAYCRWLDSNHGPLMLEAITLPTELQPLPITFG